jgi:hypothetical protein
VIQTDSAPLAPPRSASLSLSSSSSSPSAPLSPALELPSIYGCAQRCWCDFAVWSRPARSSCRFRSCCSWCSQRQSSYRPPLLVSTRATPSRYLVLRKRLQRRAPYRGIERVPSSDPAPHRVSFHGLHAPTFPDGPPRLRAASPRAVADRSRLQPKRSSRSPPYRFPSGLARSIQPGIERNDFARPGHVPGAKKMARTGHKDQAEWRSRLRGGLAGPLARPLRREMRPPACRGRWPCGGERYAR